MRKLRYLFRLEHVYGKIALRNPRIMKGDTDTDTGIIFEEISMYAARKTVSLFLAGIRIRDLSRRQISSLPTPCYDTSWKEKKIVYSLAHLSLLSLFCAFPNNGSQRKTTSSNTDELISLFYLCKVFDWQARCLRHSRLVVVIPFFFVPFINYLLAKT